MIHLQGLGSSGLNISLRAADKGLRGRNLEEGDVAAELLVLLLLGPGSSDRRACALPACCSAAGKKNGKTPVEPLSGSDAADSQYSNLQNIIVAKSSLGSSW